MPDLLTIAFIGLAALGLALFWRGWRGRRIDNHPLCRKCRFDLFGAADGSTRCPECGADLAAARAVRIGKHRRQPVFIGCGALLFAVAGTWAGLQATGVLARVNWNAHMPTWWLMIEAESEEGAKTLSILAELTARLDAGRLTDARVESLAAHGMRALRGPTTVAREWDLFMHHAWALGRLEENVVVAYVSELYQPEVFLRDALVDGGPAVIVTCRLRPDRRKPRLRSYRCRLKSLVFDDETVPVPDHEAIDWSPSASSQHFISPMMRLKDGRERRVRVEVEWCVSAQVTDPLLRNLPSPRVEWDVDHEFTTTRIDTTLPRIDLADDDATRERVRKSTSARFYAVPGIDGQPAQGYGILRVFNPPVELHVSIQVHASDGTLLDSTTLNSAGVGGLTGGGDIMIASAAQFQMAIPDPTLKTVSLTLSALPFDFQRDYYLQRDHYSERTAIWNGRLVIPDIPIEWVESLDDTELRRVLRP